jgi:tetratricopeptide (TPR) repeat protein
MLCDGFVQSYIDFYHLMHRSDPIDLDRNDVVFIRNQLVRAEESRRKGNTKVVHQSYMKLANLYSKFKDWKTSIFFYEKCFEIAQLTSDQQAEMTAYHYLGTIYQNMDDIPTAKKFHELHEKLALAVDSTEEIAKSNTELYKVYFYLAQQADDVDDLASALDLYQKCLSASKLSLDRVNEAQVMNYM